MKKHLHIIASVESGSIAEELGLEPGDAIEEINGNEIEDIFDYQYYVEDEYLDVLVLTKDGEECVLEIEKDEDEDLGITFESSLMDEYHSCCNKCMFCFIDQMPPGMRETLYFKDDDSRLSFLQGNYITLTNMRDKDIERVIRYHLSPINISVHATNPELRCKMLHNRFAGDILEKIGRFYEAGIRMNSQVVLCKGLNDGEELDRTISDLGKFLPYMESLSVVPVGLTKYREGLAPLELFEKEDAGKVLKQIHKWQDYFRENYGTTFVHASDEWFILAEQEFPDEAYYEGYGQLENGVGMLRLLIEETDYTLEALSGDERVHTLSLATGKLAYPFLRDIAAKVHEKFPNVNITVYEILNDFFGHGVTVSGLITGQDLIKQLKGKPLGEVLLLPANMFRSNEEVFLDDLTKQDVEKALQVPINIVKSDGQELIRAMLMEESEETGQLHSPYEL